MIGSGHNDVATDEICHQTLNPPFLPIQISVAVKVRWKKADHTLTNTLGVMEEIEASVGREDEVVQGETTEDGEDDIGAAGLTRDLQITSNHVDVNDTIEEDTQTMLHRW